MSFVYFLKLLHKKLLWLLVIPIAMAISIFYFTRHEVKVYSSESVIYTGIASGYSLSGNNKADFFGTSNAFDNLLSLINSRETKEEVAINLLAGHLQLKKHDPSVLSWDSFEKLRGLIPDSIRNRLVRSDQANTVLALKSYLSGEEGNPIYSLINSDNPVYSISAMDNIKALRINSSDLIKISYSTNDAAICKHTLELLEECFMRKHRLLKEGQSESVVTYFENETRNAFNRLNDAEQRFLDFNRENDIINYYEQTKAVAVEKENLDVQKHNMQMDKMANTKSLDLVNSNLKGKLYQSEYGTAVLRDRESLSDVYSKMATDNLIGRNDPDHQQKADSLEKLSASLENRLSRSVDNLYSETLTPNGIPTKNVLDEWLRTSLNVEQSKARLTVMADRKKEFEEQYRKYAPLGATLKKIERQINVSEQEYLELLHGLNMAKLTQQNNELTTKLNIVDEPYLPLKANPSKRMVQVILGFVVGFVLVLAVILARALVDRSVQHPKNAHKLIKLPLLGVFPLLNMSEEYLSKARLRIVQQLLSRLDPEKIPTSIGIVSIQENEGKSTLLGMLSDELIRLGYTISILKTSGDEQTPEGNTEIVLREFRALDTLIFKPGSFPKMDHTILVCRANRIWGDLDNELLHLFTKTTGNKPLLILNGVEADFAEPYIGEVPKQRFFLRAYFKRIFRMQFGNKKNFTT
ncbi:MAG: hypothetical protein ABI151_12050 [Chitinophagaceae bacterium]